MRDTTLVFASMLSMLLLLTACEQEQGDDPEVEVEVEVETDPPDTVLAGPGDGWWDERSAAPDGDGERFWTRSQTDTEIDTEVPEISIPPVEMNPAGYDEGGEVDDNADLAAFLAFSEDLRARHPGHPALHWVDVSRRHRIRVVDPDGTPVADAQVRIFLEGARVTVGRTRDDGAYTFFPRAFEVDPECFTVEAEVDAIRSRDVLCRGTDEITVQLATEPRPQPLQLDLAFVVDVTGTMDAELQAFEDRSRITQVLLGCGFHVRVSFIPFRDTDGRDWPEPRPFDVDLEASMAATWDASGGGDEPEGLDLALEFAMRELDWRRGKTLRLAFILTDAPAGANPRGEYTYADAMFDADIMGVRLYPLSSGGSDGPAELQLRQLAQFTTGRFLYFAEDTEEAGPYSTAALVERIAEIVDRETSSWR